MSADPRHDGDHGAYDELAVGYALHALEPEEELRFTSHLQGCERCARALDEHARTMAALASAAPEVEPPPAVLAGIRAAVAAEHRPAATAAVELAEVRRRRGSVAVRRSRLVTAAAAVTALVVALGGWVAVLQSERDREATRGDRLAAAVAALESPSAETVRLADGDGRVLAVVIASDDRMSLVLDGLAPNPEGTAYVLWGLTESGEVSALSAFDVPHGGLEVVDGVPLDVPFSELTQLMVTHEKTRTPPASTTEPVLVAGSV